jgi:malate permease and related proteins
LRPIELVSFCLQIPFRNPPASGCFATKIHFSVRAATFGFLRGNAHRIRFDYALAPPCPCRDSLAVISPGDVIASVLPVYLLIVAGALVRWLGIVRKEHDEGVMRVVYSVMLPCYMLDKILGSEVLKSGQAVMSAAGLGFGLILVGIATGLIVGRLIGLEKGTGMRTFALASGTQNFGFTAAPVVEILWSTGALAMLFVHNIGVELAMWSVGVMIMSGERGIRWQKLVNGPVVAVLIGLVLVTLGWDAYLTGPPRKAMSMIGVGAFPLGILITGCTIMDLVASEKPAMRIILGSALVRLVLAPLAFLSAAKFLPIATELRQVLVVQAAMPAAMTPIILARIYGGRPAIAVQIVVFTTALSLFSLPWIITLGCRWIGLKPLLP